MERLKKVRTKKDFSLISSLAKNIWKEHYSPIIGSDQVEYMLERFQSTPVIEKAVKEEKYQYYIVFFNGEPCGYFAFKISGGGIFLSKLYILKQYRGNGLSRSCLDKCVRAAKKEGLAKIWLTVNRNNASSLAAYYKLGFIKVREEKADIGGGYFMDDLILEKTV